MALPRRFDAFSAGIAICVGGFVAFATAAFSGLFLLIEYRQWATPLNLEGPLEIERTRTLGYGFAAFLTTVFGYVPLWHNLAHIALLAASGWLLALALRRLFPAAPWGLAVGAAAFFLFAEPVLDALSWQATILDKLAVFFTALGIYAASLIAVDDDGVPAIATANFMLLVAVFCAYNAKEAAWPLVPAVTALIFLRCVDGAARSSPAALLDAVRKTGARVAAPLLYGCYHVVVVLAHESTFSALERAHNVGGDAALNLSLYALFVTNAHSLAQALGVYAAAAPEQRLVIPACCGALAVAAAAAILTRAPRPLVRWWFWSLFAFALAAAIPSRTVFAEPFYLLVPGYYLAVTLFVTVWALVRAFPSARGVRITFAVASAALAAHLAGFAQIAPPYLHLAVMSANFQRALAAVRDQLTRTPAPSAIVFLWPQSEMLGYRFVQPPHDPALAEFLLPRGTPPARLHALNGAIVDHAYAGTVPPDPAPAAGTIAVVLGDDLRLVRLVPPAR